MKALYTQPLPEYNATALREFHDNIDVSVRALTALGKNETEYEGLLIPMLLSRLSVAFQQQLARSNSTDEDWTLSSLRQHLSRDCRSHFSCRLCKAKHHTSIHSTTSTDAPQTKPDAPRVHFAHASNFTQRRSSLGERSNVDPAPPPRVLLKTARVTVFGDGGSKIATVLFDNGADRSFITSKFATSIQANPKFWETLNLKCFANPRTGYKTVPRTTVNLLQRDGFKSAINLLVVDEISDNLDNYLTHDLRNIKHLRNLELAHPLSSGTHMDIDVLIGADHYWDYVSSHIIRESSPIAIHSAFGYLLSGPIPSTRRRAHNVQTFHISTVKAPDTELDKLVTTFWDLESVGVRDKIQANELKIAQSEQYNQYIDHNLSTEDGRYIAKSQTNFQAANVRTRNMIAKLPKEIIPVYNSIIADQLQHGYIEKVDDDDSNTGHYLPHRSVKKNSVSTPPGRHPFE
ncbi:uncharacterized protein LOC102802966 [Saccoglossus kowalevskii]|uniref:Uncharacterized protein LOC102802966 n=1 Tax=Saccoglossus kowalevskii TaxID=10224 RepID=A0ABM0N049_SACKO|nr:PREDICTED: uncharacterized protein LOC102802966 [Saccoglossus kowalevskii]